MTTDIEQVQSAEHEFHRPVEVLPPTKIAVLIFYEVGTTSCTSGLGYLDEDNGQWYESRLSVPDGAVEEPIEVPDLWCHVPNPRMSSSVVAAVAG
jgi:hypothetical protein